MNNPIRNSNLSTVLLLFACFCGLPLHSYPQASMENKVLDKVKSIPEVKEREKYAETHSKRHLRVVIWKKPAAQNKYYWVKVFENNGETYVPRFSFYVYPPKLTVKYLDPSTDSVIDYKDWKKGQTN